MTLLDRSKLKSDPRTIFSRHTLDVTCKSILISSTQLNAQRDTIFAQTSYPRQTNDHLTAYNDKQDGNV